MKIIATICLLCSITSVPIIADASQETMKSTKLEVRFDATTHEPSELVNLETGDRLALVSESAFRLEFYRIGKDIATLAEDIQQQKAVLLALDARDCQVTGSTQTTSPDGAIIQTTVYDGAQGRVTVNYSMGRDDHFIQKEIRFDPSFPEPYLLWRVEAQRFRLGDKPKEYVPFVHGCCLTHFLRGEKSGFFLGVQVPTQVPLFGKNRKVLPVPKELYLDYDGTNSIAYHVNFRFPAKQTYISERVFGGCYRLTGRLVPDAPSNVSKGRGGSIDRQSPIPPDIGESEAMLAMVRKLAIPGPQGIHVTLNGWDSGLTQTGYGLDVDPKRIEQDKGILTAAKEWLGDFEVTLGGTWGGLDHEIAKLMPEDVAPPQTPGAANILDWARGQNIGVNLWTTHSGPNPWTKLNSFCPQHVAWQNGASTCPANREYMRWHINLVTSLIRRGYSSYAEDEHFVLQGEVNCNSTAHDHLPGNCNYGWYRLRHELYQTLRKEFGKEFPIHGYRPQMDLGIWECLQVNNIFTLHDDVPIGGDRIRNWSRIRHYYHFFPSYMDQALIKNQFTDYDMLSALAVSSTYLFIGKPNATAKKWLTWAREHPEHMQGQSIFLPDWPGNGKCDAYLRLVKGSGFAFLFNGNQAEAEAELALDAAVGLDPAKTYRLGCIYPVEKATEKIEFKGCWRARLPPGEAWLMSIQPVE